MKYTKPFLKMMAILTYIPLSYVVYVYFINYVPKQGIIDDIVCGALMLSLLLAPILMWKDANKL
ncbi:hypothetical protein [Bacillus albus]|uniref:hypothetical protein n=1 Tax=Bacillus albus TaxID=2026189 RepID=UPI001021C615|nr:hypothetical protein [Bacillus albus]